MTIAVIVTGVKVIVAGVRLYVRILFIFLLAIKS